MKKFFYYLRDDERVVKDGKNKGKPRKGNPVVTVCLKVYEDGVVARGVAICSTSDSPKKSEGRLLADLRATHARYYGKEVGPVLRKRAIDVLTAVTNAENVPIFPFAKKSWFNPVLTEFEIKLIERKEIDNDRKNNITTASM